MHVQSNTGAAASAQTAQANSSDAKLKKACKDFESVLVNQMLKKMRESVQKNDLFGASKEEETFQGMMDEKLADSISQSGSMKLGDMMYAQISASLKRATHQE